MNNTLGAATPMGAIPQKISVQAQEIENGFIVSAYLQGKGSVTFFCATEEELGTKVAEIIKEEKASRTV